MLRTDFTPTSSSPFVCCLFLLTLATASILPAQGNGPAVDVLVSVTDKDGRAISTLKETDFRVREDGKIQTISSVASASSGELSIALIIDRSGSANVAALETANALDAAMVFFRSSVQPGRDALALIGFDTTSTFDRRNFADDLSQLPPAISATLRDPWGPTALYDALVHAATFLEGRHGRRFVFILSDGDDNASRTSPEDALRAIHKADVAVLAISTVRRSISSPDRGSEFLQTIAEETGGHYFDSFGTKQAENLREEFAGQYLIRYQSTNSKLDGKYQSIRIESLNKNYKIRHRTRYVNR